MDHSFSDAREGLGQLNFRLYYGAVLRQALQQARDGMLEPDWRESIADSSTIVHLRTSDPYGVRLPVITAISEMPRAAWEPGHSPGWRVAVDSWFGAARAALAEDRSIALEQHARATSLGASVAASARLVASSATEAIESITDADARNDDIARQSLSTFITQRDTLTASYGAALAAGGEDIDWPAWFERRINTWDNRLAANGARMLLQQRTSYLERLPTYW